MRTALVLLLVALAAGCARGGGSAGGNAGGSPAPSAAALDHGRTIFAANCAGCHGANGTEGGIGPSLKNERSKKNMEQAIAWIENPEPPMPKLYPSPLGERDVRDVAAYVESL